MLSVSKPASLVEQKKQQWAREREEMSHLYLPWGGGKANRLQVRNQFASTLELHQDSGCDYQETVQRERSPSLPPIHHLEERKDERRTKEVLNRNISSSKRFEFYDEDGEGDTSGYGSETVNHIRNVTNHNPVMLWHQDGKDRSSGRVGPESWPSGRLPRSTSDGDEGRPRWGDRGVATGRLWEPTNPNARLPQVPNQKKGTPSWVERGLNMIESAADVLVIDQGSAAPTNSGFDCDRSSNGSEEGNRTFIRGQNVPIEPEIKAQRENQRMKALELQSAILSQLEDQEKRRKKERESKLREERLEELRIQKQQEEDRLRLEKEKRMNQEKQLQEQRKLETLQKALEEAERKAKLEKEKRFNSLKQNYSTSSVPGDLKLKIDESVVTEISNHLEPNSPAKTNQTYEVHSARSQMKTTETQRTTGFNSPTSVGPGSGNVNLYIHNVPPLAIADNQFNIVPLSINGNGEIVSAPPNGIQLAVLVPQNLSNSLYSVSLNSLNNVNDLSDTGKVLTPRKYRIPKTRDVSTQTDQNTYISTSDKIPDTENTERHIDKEYSNIDENQPHDSSYNTLKKDRRKSEERYKKDLETRPKWGVNRPAAQYKKQSEKDPFYSQKRKMRQKYRAQARQYLSQSSDDSRSPSPLTRSEKTMDNNLKTRNSVTQSYWKNKRSSQDYSKSNSEATLNAVSEFVNLSQITANDSCDNKKSPKMSPSKRITLSQKFINDKYGNRRLWIDDVNDRSSKANLFDIENRKKLIDQLNTAKRDFLERNDDHSNLVIKH